MDSIKVAVIGLGPAGLTALKSLREEGFAAVAFERRAAVGGLWSLSPDPSHTSVTPETVANVSKFISGFSDFPLPKEYPTYPSAAQVAQYFQSYARHFELDQHIRFNTTVSRVTRAESGPPWLVHVSGPDGNVIESFDKVVFATGSETTPVWPPMPGRERFTGLVLHGQSYRSPEAFAGKRVLVVGIGNTACEVSLSLVRHAAELYQAYRRGRILVSRYLDDGIPTDSTFSWPVLRLKYLLDYKMPWLASAVVDRLMMHKMVSDAARSEPDESGTARSQRLARAGDRIRNDWRLTPCPSMSHEHPAVQEHFVPALYAGEIVPVRGFKAFVGASQVLLDDDATVEVDAVIFCTGYTYDFAIMPDLDMDGACGLPLTTAQDLAGADPGVQTQDDQACTPSRSKPPHLPRLYQMLFPPRYASSVAFLSWMAPQENVWCICELASMAVAQIWAAESSRDTAGTQAPAPGGRKPSLLPSRADMDAHVDGYHAWWRREWAQEPSMRPGFIRAHTFYRFLHDMAGTAMYDTLDHLFTGLAWRLWWRDRELYTWLAGGPMNSYAWRLLDTNPRRIPGCGRTAWPGARRAVQDAVGPVFLLLVFGDEAD